jgi:DnaJ-domain-containing protein 1
VKLACWFCAREFDPVDVVAEGVLEPRESFAGGPLYHYRCPGCGRESICERNARARLLAHPRAVVPIFDRLHAYLDPALAEEDAARRAWWARNGGVIAWFHREFVAAIDAGIEAPPPAEGEPSARPPPAAHSEAPPPRDPHDVLGVPRGAPRDDVVRAFRRLAKEHHPDLFEHADGSERERAQRRFIEIVNAYDALRNGP